MKVQILKSNLGAFTLVASLFCATAYADYYDSNGYRSFCSNDPGSPAVFVQADAPAGGDGSKRNPFNSLADVEANSVPGDTICVKQSTGVLDGGIILKEGQRLIGIGPTVLSRRDPLSVAAKITNKDPSCSTYELCDAHAVTLADNVEVAGIHIIEPDCSGVYGKDINNVSIHHVRITNANLGSTESDQTIGCLNLPNNPIALTNVDQARISKSAIDGYHIGISYVANVAQDFFVDIDNVKIESPRPLAPSPDTLWGTGKVENEGIQIATFHEDAVIHANIHNTTVMGLAYDGTFGQTFTLGTLTSLVPNRKGTILADFDSVFYDSGHNNGLALISRDNSEGLVDANVKNSVFTNSSDNISVLAWNAPESFAFFLKCDAEGFTDPIAPAATLKIKVDNSILKEARQEGGEPGRGVEALVYNNIWLHGGDFSPNATLDVTVQNTSIINSDGFSAMLGILFWQWSGSTLLDLYAGNYNFDFGGGVNGSVGNNRIFGAGQFEVQYQRSNYPDPTVPMQNNWWGTSDGLDPSKVKYLYTPWTFPDYTNGTVDASNPLTSDPGAPVLNAGTHSVDDDACGDNLMEYNGHGYQMCRVLDGDYVDDADEAEQTCLAAGGALLTVNDQYETDFLVRVFNSAFWVDTGTADCAKFNTDNGAIISAACDGSARVVCEFNMN